MKSKVLIFVTALFLTGIFSSCSEEEINPNDSLNGEVIGQGVQKDDPGF